VPGDIEARLDARLAVMQAKDSAMQVLEVHGDRQPWFCSGCPHNTSTKVPEGSRAMAGIGCHFMSIWMDRATVGFTQMGGEGVPWVGQQPFSTDQHMFANIGDGTYFHSGILAIRQSIAAGVNITYKILYNDAVAMTGGQQVGERPEGHSVIQIAQSMRAEGAAKIMIVTDEPENTKASKACPKASPSSTATRWTPCSVSSARSRAPRSSSTTRPARPKSAAAASAAPWSTRPSAW
jgi:indolepyruvate ferredoxin oxidoreductase